VEKSGRGENREVGAVYQGKSAIKKQPLAGLFLS
jgi:hypothetical protein